MAEEIGKLVVDFEADISEFKLAISEVKSLMKDMSSETRKSTADFATLAGVTAGLTNFGLNAMAKSIQGINSGISDYLQNNPDFVMAQSDLSMTFRDLAEDVGPGATSVLEGFNSLLQELKNIGAFELLNKTLEITGSLLEGIADWIKWIQDNSGGSTTQEKKDALQEMSDNQGDSDFTGSNMTLISRLGSKSFNEDVTAGMSDEEVDNLYSQVYGGVSSSLVNGFAQILDYLKLVFPI